MRFYINLGAIPLLSFRMRRLICYIRAFLCIPIAIGLLLRDCGNVTSIETILLAKPALLSIHLRGDRY